MNTFDTQRELGDILTYIRATVDIHLDSLSLSHLDRAHSLMCLYYYTPHGKLVLIPYLTVKVRSWIHEYNRMHVNFDKTYNEEVKDALYSLVYVWAEEFRYVESRRIGRYANRT